MNTNVHSSIKDYVKRAGKERILLYLFLVLCTAGYVALDAFADKKYIGLHGEPVNSFLIQCGMYICGGGILGLLILLLLEGEKLVVAKEKICRIPSDILGVVWFVLLDMMGNTAANMIFASLAFYQGGDGYSSSRYVPFFYEVFITLVTAVMAVPFILVLSNLLIIFILQLRNGSLKEHLWIRKPYARVRAWLKEKRKLHLQRKQIYNSYECLRKNRRTARVFWFFEIGIIIVLFVLSCFLMNYGEIGLVFLGVTGACGIQALAAWRHFGHGRQMADIFQMIERLGSGEETMVSMVGENSVYYPIARQLCSIQEKVARSAQAQLKSERMKVDLITNVSHDLKTPLTSVISYVDLLSKQELPQEAADYVEILKKKSARLEAMIYNVFDIAKATSGNATLELTTLHMNKLVEQTLADMQDVVEDSGFILRTQMTQEDTAFVGDSGKLYRVCQNIIENALKYSLSGSRIFIRTWCDDSEVALQIVNTSAYEMHFDEESIVERFTRGDDSRTTEGNGLGLSIAKSFTEACGGTFEIFVEGDQFKALVKFPKNKKEQSGPSDE